MKIFRIFTTAISFCVIGTGIFVYLKSNQSSTLITRVIASNEFHSLSMTEEWQVLSVHDGDTLKAKKDNTSESFRFCGIDAPEISQPFGLESRNYLRSLVSPKNQVQISTVGTDRYRRKIGEVFIVGTDSESFVNEEMLKGGMAYYYAQYADSCPNKIALENAEAIAKQNKVGVWSGNYEKPWDYRKRLK